MNHESRSEPPDTRTPPRALAILGVRSGEIPVVAWVSALFFVVQSSHGIGLNTADALFFLRFGVEHLPVMITVSGITVMLAILGYAFGLSSRGAARWLWRVPLTGAAWLIGERVAISFELPGTYPVVWLSAQVVMMVTFTLMWNAAGEVCTTRQAKRLFPLFASAGIAGGIFGNAITGPVASLIGTENLLIVQAGLLVGGGLLTLGASRRFFTDDDRGDISFSALEDMRAGLEITVRSPLLRLVAGTTAALSILFYLVVFPFSEVVAGSFETEAEVAGYLGVFSSIATAATFVVSLFIAKILFTRLGVVVALLLVPIVYAAGFALWLVAFGLVTASLVRGAQWIAVNAIGGTALSSLFNVVRGRRRGQVMAFVTAVPTQLGTVGSGLILLAARGMSDTVRLSASLAVAAVAVLLVARMRSAYRAALLTAVDQGLVDVFTAATPGLQKPALDGESRRALRRALDDPHPARRRVATIMVGRLGDDAAMLALRDRLADPEASVRLAALDALADNDSIGRVELESILDDDDPEVRLQAARLLLRSADPPGDTVAARLIRDSDPRVRAVGASLDRSGASIGTVAGLLSNQNPIAISAGLEAIAWGVRPDSFNLSAFATHTDRGVRIAAAGALTAVPGNEETLRYMLDDVSPGVRSAAANALAAGPDGIATIHEVLDTGSVRASAAALAGLARFGEGQKLGEWIDRELDRVVTLRRHRSSLQADGRPASAARVYLTRVLARRQERLQRWVIRALEMVEGGESLSAVRRAAWSTDAETRSQALEALETVADRAIGRRLVALLEDEAAETPADSREALRELATDFDPWLRALAIRALAEELSADLESIQQVARRDEDALVRSAAPEWKMGAADPAAGLDVIDRVLALQQVPLFSALDPEELHLVSLATTERAHGARETVYEGGTTGDEMLVILEGTVEIRIDSDAPVLVTRRPGEFVGELGVLRGRPRMADVVAGPSGVSGLVVGAAAIRGMLEERPEAAVSMLATLADRMGELLSDGTGDAPPVAGRDAR